MSCGRNERFNEYWGMEARNGLHGSKEVSEPIVACAMMGFFISGIQVIYILLYKNEPVKDGYITKAERRRIQ